MWCSDLSVLRVERAGNYTLSKHAKKRSRKDCTPLTDREVELVRHLHEREGWGYGRIARKMGKHKNTIQKYCNYSRR